MAGRLFSAKAGKHFILRFHFLRCGKIVVVSGCATKVFRVESSYRFADKDKLYTSVVIDEQFIIPPWYDINIVWHADMKIPLVLILELSRKCP